MKAEQRFKELMNRLESAFSGLSKEVTDLVIDLKSEKVKQAANKAISDCKDGIKNAYDLIDGK